MEYFDWAMKMLRDLGGEVGPYLRGIFDHLAEGAANLRFSPANPARTEADAWSELSSRRRMTRLKLAAKRVAELKDVMGNALSDDGLEGFVLVQKYLFEEDIDDLDRFIDLLKSFQNCDSQVAKEALNETLEKAKTEINSRGLSSNGVKLSAKIKEVYPDLYQYKPADDFFLSRRQRAVVENGFSILIILIILLLRYLAMQPKHVADSNFPIERKMGWRYAGLNERDLESS